MSKIQIKYQYGQILHFAIFSYICAIIYKALEAPNRKRYNVRNVTTHVVVGVTNCALLHKLYVQIRKHEGLTDSMSYWTFRRKVDGGEAFRDLGYLYEKVEIYEKEAVESGELVKMLVK